MAHQVISTLGPATSTPGDWHALLEAGATSFRLNTSHLTLAELERWLDRLRNAFPADSAPQVILDLQGSKWRLGTLEPLSVAEDEQVEFILPEQNDSVGPEAAPEAALDTRHGARIPVPHGDFFEAAASSNGIIRVHDGRVELRIESVSAESISATVTRSGTVASRKGITLPGTRFRKAALLEKDRSIVERFRGGHRIAFALSYIRDAEEMRNLAAAIGDTVRIIAKLERPEALQEALRIAGTCDEVWLCRGDLGSEMGLHEMARAVHAFSRTVASLPIPAVMAGEVLEHMSSNPLPTRSEICHLLDILAAGYAGVVLSDETAIGKYSVECCRMARAVKWPGQ